MSKGSCVGLVRFLDRIGGVGGTTTLTDRELLERFVVRGNEDAFAALMRRHGPTVLGVCRRVLRDAPDVEDAFQATFLVLARKAGGVRRPEQLGNWLYGVAFNAARKARDEAARRRERERQAAHRPADAIRDDAVEHDLLPAIDTEIERLPERMRSAVILCNLQGKTTAEAARQLGCPRGTILSRLAHARELLRVRLSRRGVALSAGLVAALGTLPATAAVVPAALLEAAARAARVAAGDGRFTAVVSGRAAGLAQEVLRTMFLSKVKFVAAGLLALAVLVGGACLAAHGPLAEQQPPPPREVAGPAVQEAPPPEKPRPLRTDRLGDPLPPGALARLGTVRLRHGQQVFEMAFAPDGRTLASAAGDGIRLWDTANGRLRSRLGKAGVYATGLAFAPGGKTLASVDDQIHLWDLATGRRLRQFGKNPLPYSGVFFRRDGKRLATREQDGTIRLWDVAAGRQVRCLPVGAYLAAFSADLARLAVVQPDDKVVRLGDSTGKEMRRLVGHESEVHALALSADGAALASADENTLRLWDPVQGKTVWQVKMAAVAALAFSADGTTLAVRPSRPDSAPQLWDVKTGKELLPAFEAQAGRGPLGSLAIVFSPDGQLLAACQGNSLCLWDVASRKRCLDYPGHRDGIKSLAFAATGKVLVSGAGLERVQLWDPSAWKELYAERKTQDISPVALSADGKRLAAAQPGHRAIVVRDVATGVELRRLAVVDLHAKADLATPPFLFSLAFSGDGKRLAAGNYGADTSRQTVQVWEADSGKEISRFSPGSMMPGPLVLSADGKTLAAAGGFDGVIRLLRADTGQEIFRLAGAPGLAEAMTFSDDGRLLACGSGERDIYFWEVVTGRLYRRLTCPQRTLCSLAFSRDGRLLASGSKDNKVVVWETFTGKQSGRFEGHAGWVSALAFSPDGKVLVSGSEDTTALVWDVAGSVTAARPRDETVSAEELESLWKALGDVEAQRGFAAVVKLAAAPRLTVPFLERRLAPIKGVTKERVAKLIAALDEPQFAARAAATQELQNLGELAAPALRQVLAGQPTLESRRRVQHLLQGCEGPVREGEPLRSVRALAVLEHIGTAAAGEVLAKLAAGAPEARLTREAQDSLERLRRRGAVP
jgi:RNA polymerase sigma factor (sigma-70 family)